MNRNSIWILPVTLSLILFAFSRPWDILEFGPDEGMELSKALLLAKKPALAERVWNDQPWLYSQIFGALFSQAGFQAWIPRLVTLMSATAFLLSAPRFLPGKLGFRHVMFIALFFWTSPNLLHLSLSAMCELPATALALIAVAALARDREERYLLRSVAAAALFAVAVHIKLTAMLAAPAILVRFFLMTDFTGDQSELKRQPAGAGRAKEALKCGAVFFIMFSAVWILGWAVAPSWNWGQILGNHQLAARTSAASEMTFSPQTLFEAPGILLGTLVGFGLLVRDRERRACAVPLVVYLGTVMIVHFVNRPWWYYYSVHFFLPLSALGGWALGELTRSTLNRSVPDLSPQPALQRPRAILLCSAVLALWGGFAAFSFRDELVSLRHHTGYADAELVKVIKGFRKDVRWLFTRGNIWAAQAECLIPPELTILSKKRFWTGGTSEEVVVETVERYNCEVLVLLHEVEPKSPAWEKLLESEYKLVWSDGARDIYALKTLAYVPPLDTESVLMRLGM